MKRKSGKPGDLELDFGDEECTGNAGSAPQIEPHLFGFGNHDLDPIRKVAAKLNPDQDTTRLGSWGILFFVVGAYRGQRTVLAAPDPSLVDMLRAQIDSSTPVWAAELLSLSFSELMKEWLINDLYHSMARRRIGATGVPASAISEGLIAWSAISTTLNSFAELDTPQFTPIRSWAHDHPERWEQLFLAAGHTLSRDPDVKWHEIAGTIRATAGDLKDDVRALMPSLFR